MLFGGTVIQILLFTVFTPSGLCVNHWKMLCTSYRLPGLRHIGTLSLPSLITYKRNRQLTHAIRPHCLMCISSARKMRSASLIFRITGFSFFMTENHLPNHLNKSLNSTAHWFLDMYMSRRNMSYGFWSMAWLLQHPGEEYYSDSVYILQVQRCW